MNRRRREIVYRGRYDNCSKCGAIEINALYSWSISGAGSCLKVSGRLRNKVFSAPCSKKYLMMMPLHREIRRDAWKREVGEPFHLPSAARENGSTETMPWESAGRVCIAEMRHHVKKMVPAKSCRAYDTSAKPKRTFYSTLMLMRYALSHIEKAKSVLWRNDFER